MNKGREGRVQTPRKRETANIKTIPCTKITSWPLICNNGLSSVCKSQNISNSTTHISHPQETFPAQSDIAYLTLRIKSTLFTSPKFYLLHKMITYGYMLISIDFFFFFDDVFRLLLSSFFTYLQR